MSEPGALEPGESQRQVLMKWRKQSTLYGDVWGNWSWWRKFSWHNRRVWSSLWLWHTMALSLTFQLVHACWFGFIWADLCLNKSRLCRFSATKVLSARYRVCYLSVNSKTLTKKALRVGDQTLKANWCLDFRASESALASQICFFEHQC